MSKRTVIGRKAPVHPHPHPSTTIGRPDGVSVVRVPDYRPLWGFGWCRSGAPSVDLDGLTLPEALDAFRDAWRRCNGDSWAWLFTYAGKPVVNDVDDLLEQLDDVGQGSLPYAELQLGAA